MGCCHYRMHQDRSNLYFNHRHGLYTLEIVLELGRVQILPSDSDTIVVGNVTAESWFESLGCTVLVYRVLRLRVRSSLDKVKSLRDDSSNFLGIIWKIESDAHAGQVNDIRKYRIPPIVLLLQLGNTFSELGFQSVDLLGPV